MDEKNKSSRGAYLAIGVALGTAAGMLTNSIGLWIPIGAAIGLVLEYGVRKHNEDNRKEEQ